MSVFSGTGAYGGAVTGCTGAALELGDGLGDALGVGFGGLGSTKHPGACLMTYRTRRRELGMSRWAPS